MSQTLFYLWTGALLPKIQIFTDFFKKISKISPEVINRLEFFFSNKNFKKPSGL